MIPPILLPAVLQTAAATQGYPVDTDCREHRIGRMLAMSGCLTSQSAVWDRRVDRKCHAALVRTEVPPVDLRAAQRTRLRHRDAIYLGPVSA
ncbi:hypothetical protein [Aureimonas pseudogalii]|uniref:Uncharacterized protein YecT (DUF1311 family) n=1 Tax=Aureimonas pseudogalii TaxID=1744844 RepID=A0A7W6H9N0_9HYPH|nr:hypothetical protein [Aureimonas pseudogalii]MBB4000913.1 uncharacterized protein YecT (DUF1311 family) [Aureimonas pseudogalii]